MNQAKKDLGLLGRDHRLKREFVSRFLLQTVSTSAFLLRGCGICWGEMMEASWIMCVTTGDLYVEMVYCPR
jgi:hypothetical protein